MSRLGLALGLLLVCAGCRGPDLIVVDQRGQPVEGAEITWGMPSFAEKGWTDAEGEARSSWWNVDQVLVEKAGYRCLTQWVRSYPRPWRVTLLPAKPLDD